MILKYTGGHLAPSFFWSITILRVLRCDPPQQAVQFENSVTTQSWFCSSEHTSTGGVPGDKFWQLVSSISIGSYACSELGISVLLE